MCSILIWTTVRAFETLICTISLPQPTFVSVWRTSSGHEYTAILHFSALVISPSTYLLNTIPWMTLDWWTPDPWKSKEKSISADVCTQIKCIFLLVKKTAKSFWEMVKLTRIFETLTLSTLNANFFVRTDTEIVNYASLASFLNTSHSMNPWSYM